METLKSIASAVEDFTSLLDGFDDVKHFGKTRHRDRFLDNSVWVKDAELALPLLVSRDECSNPTRVDECQLLAINHEMPGKDVCRRLGDGLVGQVDVGKIEFAIKVQDCGTLVPIDPN